MLSISLIKFIQALSYFVDSDAGTNIEKKETLHKAVVITTQFISYDLFKYKERRILNQMDKLNLVHIEDDKVFWTDLGSQVLTVLLEIE